MKYKALILWFSILMSNSSLESSLTSIIEKVEENPAFISSQLGICVLKESSGEVLFEHNANKSMVPRSILKVITTAAILDKLGENARFSTSLYGSGALKDHVLEGDLILVGSGDPSFGSSRFTSQKEILQSWAREVKNRGITIVRGSIILDASCFEKALCPPTWQFDDIGNYYGVGACGLNYHENFYNITFSLGKKIGALTKILTVSPKLEGLEVVNEVTSEKKGSGDNAYVFGIEHNLSQVIRGTVPLDKPTFTIKAAVPDPAKLLGDEFKKALLKEGIEVEKGVKASYEPVKCRNLDLITESKSDRLIDLIKNTHHLSINLYTECFLKMLGEGKLNSGLNALEDYLKKIGVNTCGVQFADGSGLSLYNLVTPKAMCEFLLKVKDEPYYSLWKSSLTSYGKNAARSYSNYFSEEHIGKVLAKTGTSKQDRSVVGYMETKNHGRVIFCLISNHYLSSPSSFKENIRSFFSELFTDSSFSNLSVTSIRYE